MTIFRPSRASNSEVNSLTWPKFELFRDFMAALVTCKYEEYPMKNEVTIDLFLHYKYMWAYFRHSRASNTEVNSLIWPKFELIREFMAVLPICKFDEDPIKMEGTINRIRSNMRFFGFQGQVTPKRKIWSGRNSNSSENLWLFWLPASLMKIRSKLNALSIG